MHKQQLSDQKIHLQQSSTDHLIQYKIWLSKHPKHYQLYLTIKNKSITIGSKNYNQKQDINIQTDDFIGYNQQQINNDWIKLTLNKFSKQKKLFSNQKRYLSHYTIFLYTQEFSQKLLDQLKNHLFSIASNKQYSNKFESPKLMIYFNPSSGSNSKKHLNRILKFIQYTNFSFDILETQRRNHCQQHINNELDFKKYHGIVIVSGDGLMHQFVNSKAVGIIPVTHVPAGSGNAFSKYQTKLANQACQSQQAIYLAIKGRIKKFNLVEINLEKQPAPIYSFLSLEWCFLADIDMNSQFLRCLGGLRFEIYGLWRLIKVRKYKGKFTYSKTSTNLPSLKQEINDEQNFITQDQTYLHQLITFIPYISDSYQISPLLELQDEAMDMQKMTEKSGRFQLIKYMLNCQTGDQFDRQKKTVKQGYKFDWDKIKSFRLQPNGQDRGVFGIDGERYQSQNVQAKISDKKVLTFS